MPPPRNTIRKAMIAPWRNRSLMIVILNGSEPVESAPAFLHVDQSVRSASGERSTRAFPARGISGVGASHETVRTKGSLSPNGRQAVGLQAALRGIKHLAAPQRHKSVAESHRRCQFGKMHRAHR